MFISIVIPVYNSEKYIKKGVESILSQSHTNFELILVNDGSTDNSLGIINELAVRNSKIKVVNKPNGGASSARNAGIKESKGNFIAFIDSDDTVSENYIYDLVSGLNFNASIDIVANGFKVVEVDQTVKTVAPQTEEVLDLNKIGILEKIPLLCLSSPISKLFKRSIIEDNHLLFEESINIGEDLVFVMDYLRHSDFLAISNKSNYLYERREGSLSTSLHSFKEELASDFLINKACKATYQRSGYSDAEIIQVIDRTLNKHGYRILFALYNKGKIKYSRKERVIEIKAIDNNHIKRLRQYFRISSFKGKLLAFLLNKNYIFLSDYLLAFIIKQKKF